MRLEGGLFLVLCLISGLWAINASTPSFVLTNFHYGLEGANFTTPSFQGSETLTHEQAGTKNASTVHYFFNYGWFNISISGTFVNETIRIIITYPTPPSLGVQVSNCHMNITVQTNATNTSTINQNISMWALAPNGTYYLLNSYQTTDLNHSFNITVPTDMADNFITINGTAKTLGIINYSNNQSLTILGTTWCSGSINTSVGLSGTIIFLTMFIFLGILWGSGFDKVMITWAGNGIMIAGISFAEIITAQTGNSISGIFDMLFVFTCILFTFFSLFILLEVLAFFLAKTFRRKHHSILFANLEIEEGYK